jgi:hypothetical protein
VNKYQRTGSEANWPSQFDLHSVFLLMLYNMLLLFNGSKILTLFSFHKGCNDESKARSVSGSIRIELYFLNDLFFSFAKVTDVEKCDLGYEISLH